MSVPETRENALRRRFVQVANAQEAKTFNFLSGRKPGPRTTIIESIGNLVKSCLGGGILTIHEAYMGVGLWSALVLNLILGLAVTYLMIILAKTAQKAYGRTHTSEMSYPDVAEAVIDICPFPKLRKYSKCFRYLVDFTIMIDLFGSCVCYQIIIARSIQDLSKYFIPGFDWDVRYIVAILVVPCILLCWILSLKYLAPFSIAADLIIVAVTCTTVYYAIQNPPKPLKQMAVFKTMSGFLMFLGVCVFSMEGVGVTLPIENNMKNPYKVGLVIWCGMSIVMSLVMISGFFGYYGFGEASRTPVTMNFPFNSWNITLKVGLALMVYVTFGLNFWVPFELAWAYIGRWHVGSNHPIFWKRFWRTLIVIVITITGIVFPDCEKLMGVLGAFCLSNMGFIYPSFFELMLDWKDPGLGVLYWRLWKFLIIFTFGVFLMTVGSVNNLISLIKSAFSL